MNLFIEILNTRSLTVIHYKVEPALATAQAAEKETLSRIYESNTLDEIYALCHDYLGNPEEAKRLRNWLASK